MMPTSTSQSTSVSGASSLLSKYQYLTSCISSTRKTVQSTETDIASLQSSITELQQQQDEMNDDLQAAIQETNQFNRSLCNSCPVLKEYQKLSQTEMELQQQIRCMEGHLQSDKAQRAEQRREFHQICREFRMNVRRNRISFQGLEKVQLPAEGEDEELENAKENKIKSDIVILGARRSSLEAKGQKNMLEKEAVDRTMNLQQQRNQLKEIRRDVQEKEREIQNLEQSTKELEEFNDGFARSALKRRQQNTARANATPLVHHSLNSRASVTPSPHGIGRGPVINPYNTSIPNPYKKSTSTTSTSNSDAKSSLARQYPHRAGRIRVDRQFSTGISIGSIGGCDWDGNEEYNRDAPQGTSVAESKNDLEDSSSLDSGGPSFSSFRGRVGGGGAKRAKFGDDTNGTFSSQSSSDDDDVLTFTPFQPED